ncbi:hypothetical protein HMPREF9997_02641 [Corynebacterium durum F0235]|uniref:Uncharacterized protein n=1 Tax=Corynebacterium durum F0235 TaxID=1035195 RepID=L1M9G1_9CORY|nr:hypothetical protein HMPREF9997_02641 [Corynebacterium durum F0235]
MPPHKGGSYAELNDDFSRVRPQNAPCALGGFSAAMTQGKFFYSFSFV